MQRESQGATGPFGTRQLPVESRQRRGGSRTSTTRQSVGSRPEIGNHVKPPAQPM
jgi:hypothetical protein